MSESLDMFRRMCLCRYFELKVKEVYEKGLIKGQVYLSIGQESIPAAIATVIKDYYIFAQHRAHSTYLSFGGDPVKLIDELLGLPSGCCGGIGGSPCIQDSKINMFGHHGLIGEQVPIAVGAALGSGHKTVCFFGDGAAEEDYVFSAMGFAVTHKLPVLFVCEDNNLSILTEKRVRRSWEMAKVTEALGMPSVDTMDDPWVIKVQVGELIKNLPAFINIQTCRHLWHTGVGIDGQPKWDRFLDTKDRLRDMGISAHGERIIVETRKYVDELWESRLSLIPSRK